MVSKPRPILPGHIEAGYAYPSSTWAAQLGRKDAGAWHVSGYRGNPARPSYNRPEVLAGPFDTREQAQVAAEAIRAAARAVPHG